MLMFVEVRAASEILVGMCEGILLGRLEWVTACFWRVEAHVCYELAPAWTQHKG